MSNTVTTDLTHIFASMPGQDRLPEAYAKAIEYLKKHGVECSYVKDQDFRDIKLLDANSEIYTLAQCRVTPQTDQVEAYTRRFDNGEPLRWPPIAVLFENGNAIAYGNTRVGGKKASTNPCGPFILVDPNLNLGERAKVLIVAKLASYSNPREKYAANPDEPKDVIKQTKEAWDLVKSTDRDGTCGIWSDNRRILAEWDAAADKEKYRRYQWYGKWLKETKGEDTWSETMASRMYNIAFDRNKKQDSSKITEFTDDQIKESYEKVFPQSKWNPEENCIEELDTLGSTWQFQHPWGTLVGQVGNCITNLTNKLLQRQLVENKFHLMSGVEIVVKGESGAKDPLEKYNHIKTIIKAAKEYNMRPARRTIGSPAITRIFIPQMFRDATEVIDCHIAYEWSEEEGEFTEVTREESSKIVHVKQCTTCKKVKIASGPDSEFGVCNSKGYPEKDGLQPRCGACSREHQRAYSRKKKKASS